MPSPYMLGFIQDYDSGMQPVAVSGPGTVLTTQTVAVTDFIVVNLTGSAQVVTVTDNQGTSMAYAKNFSVPANSILQLVQCTKGVKMQGIVVTAQNPNALNVQVAGYV